MAKSDRVRYVSTFRAPTEYERQLEEARKRAALAEALAQQEYQPMEGTAAPIPRAAPLVKALQGYLTAREGRMAKEAEAEASQIEGDYAQRMLGRMQGGYTYQPSAQNVEAMKRLPSETDEQYRARMLSPETFTNRSYEQMLAAAPAETTLAEVTPTSRYVKSPEQALEMGSTSVGAAALKNRPVLAARLAEMLKGPEAGEFGTEERYDAEGKGYVINKRTGARQYTGAIKPAETPKPVTRIGSEDLGDRVRTYFSDGTSKDTPKGLAPTAVGGKSSESAEGLRKEFTTQTAQYRDVADAFAKIKNAAMNPSAANDLALIFSYMRALDPASTVREGEFATAQNAAGVNTQIRNLYNKIVSGERLSQPQRQDFLQSSYGMVESQMPNVQQLVDRYTGIANRYGLNPEDIVTNPLQPLMIPRLTGDNDPMFEKLKKGDLFITPDGKIMRKR